MKPHVLLFHCHDLGRHLPCYGVNTVHAPNTTRLAEEGVRFTNAFCVAPQCSPSRASMFTGRYPHANGVMGLTHAEFAWDLHPTERHMAAHLADAGYHTASIGVIHETHRPAQEWGYHEREELRGAAADATTVCDRTIAFLERYVGEAVGRGAIADGAANVRQPFFLSAGCFEPHRTTSSDDAHRVGFCGDYLSPDDGAGVHVPSYLADTPGTREELAGLQGAIRHMDAQFGRVLDVVDRLGIRENTLVIFTTDHGIAMPRAKCTCYDPGLEIALILRLPSRPGWSGAGRWTN